MSPRILVIIGTPLPDTYNHALARTYIDASRKAGADVRVIDLATDPIPDHPHTREQLRAPRDARDLQLDPVVAAYVDSLLWAQHVTVFHPQWWGTMPAALKAFVDRVFLAGAAFSFREGKPLPERLLTGRTARVVMTMDSSRWWNRLAYRNAAETSLTRATFWYCGIKTIGISRFGPVRLGDGSDRDRWLTKVASLGSRDGATRPREVAPTATAGGSAPMASAGSAPLVGAHSDPS